MLNLDDLTAISDARLIQDAELADIEVRGVRDLSSISECERRRFDDCWLGGSGQLPPLAPLRVLR